MVDDGLSSGEVAVRRWQGRRAGRVRASRTVCVCVCGQMWEKNWRGKELVVCRKFKGGGIQANTAQRMVLESRGGRIPLENLQMLQRNAQTRLQKVGQQLLVQTLHEAPSCIAGLGNSRKEALLQRPAATFGGLQTPAE